LLSVGAFQGRFENVSVREKTPQRPSEGGNKLEEVAVKVSCAGGVRVITLHCNQAVNPATNTSLAFSPKFMLLDFGLRHINLISDIFILLVVGWGILKVVLIVKEK